jgi:hypothetical protein
MAVTIVMRSKANDAGAEDGGKDRLGRASPRAAIAGTDFAPDHGGPNRVPVAPVGRVVGGIAEKREQGRRFSGQMRGNALTADPRPSRVEQANDLGENYEMLYGDNSSLFGYIR